MRLHTADVLTDCLVLVAEESRCTLLPTLGGSITAWTIAGQSMLRSALPGALARQDPFGTSSFPLVPYSNRIGRSEFCWQGRTIALRSNFSPEPHAIHGLGWKRQWQVDRQTANTATMTLEHRGDADWPWPFLAEQRLTLMHDRLVIGMQARNLADEPVPLAFGHHPYFDAEGADLSFRARRVWMTGNDGLPARPVVPAGRFDFTGAGGIGDRDIDHCYDGVTGSARIAWKDRPLALEIDAENLDAAVVYIPAGQAAFCYEPVPHINNALNLPDHEPGMPVVLPGESFRATITLRAVAS